MLQVNETVGRVTAGLPSLSPHKRSRRETVERTRAFTESAIEEQKQRDRQALLIDSQDDATNYLARLGRPMHADKFIQKLHKLNSNLVFERSVNYPRLTGIYVHHPITDLERLMGKEERRHVCGMESEWMPEFSQSHHKTERVPDTSNPGQMKDVRTFTGETRGWRTVLARLIRERLVSKELADKEFSISAGRQSYNWKELTS